MTTTEGYKVLMYQQDIDQDKLTAIDTVAGYPVYALTEQQQHPAYSAFRGSRLASNLVMRMLTEHKAFLESAVSATMIKLYGERNRYLMMQRFHNYANERFSVHLFAIRERGLRFLLAIEESSSIVLDNSINYEA